MMIIPLILPLLIWGAVAITGVIIGGAVIHSYFDDNPEKKGLGIIGMQTSGKTLLLSKIRGIPLKDQRTSREEYEEFTHKMKNGREIIISKGIDIGGGEMHIVEYEKIIQKSDLVLFLFKINEYLQNKENTEGYSYQRLCNSRFDLLYKLKRDKNTIMIIGTHKDKTNLSDRDLETKFFQIVRNKTYSQMVSSPIFVNLTDEQQLNKLIEKIF